MVCPTKRHQQPTPFPTRALDNAQEPWTLYYHKHWQKCGSLCNWACSIHQGYSNPPFKQIIVQNSLRSRCAYILQTCWMHNFLMVSWCQKKRKQLTSIVPDSSGTTLQKCKRPVQLLLPDIQGPQTNAIDEVNLLWLCKHYQSNWQMGWYNASDS